MRQFFTFILITFTSISSAQISFSNQSNLLALPNFETNWVPVAVVDMNKDSLDDIVRIDSSYSVYVDYQSSGIFQNKFVGTVIDGVISICVADVDKNGFNDILVGGSDYIEIFKADSLGNFTAQNIYNSLNFTFLLQGVNFIDLNNDGWLDLYACNDNGENKRFRNDGSGNFIEDPSIAPANQDEGNYATVWCDYDNDGDQDFYLSKCIFGASPGDPKIINLLYQNNGNGTFTEVGNAAGVADPAQSWLADFGDIDNDGDFDLFVVNHEDSSRLYENLGNGIFQDITLGSGLYFDLTKPDFQSIFRDFDNDGFLDLIVTGENDLLFKNNGNKTFSTVSNPYPSTRELYSFACGDLNHDGFLDLYVIYAGNFADALYMNNTNNGNNYLMVELEGTTSNNNAVGARLELYGTWGKQIREVRAGDGYSIMNSFKQHFGLGNANQIDSLIIKWPSGTKQIILQPNSNQYLKIKEKNNVSTLSINKNDLIRFYPNPFQTQGKFIIPKNILDQNQNLSLHFYDVLGKEIFQQEINSTETIIKNKQLKSGTYFWKLQNENTIFKSDKIIVLD